MLGRKKQRLRRLERYPGFCLRKDPGEAWQIQIDPQADIPNQQLLSYLRLTQASGIMAERFSDPWMASTRIGLMLRQDR